MGIVLIVIGSLLALFGGGCVLLVATFILGQGDLASHIFMFSLFGLLPLALGVFLIRKGAAMRRARRAANEPS